MVESDEAGSRPTPELRSRYRRCPAHPRILPPPPGNGKKTEAHCRSHGDSSMLRTFPWQSAVHCLGGCDQYLESVA
jgi:hypothetical protein